LRLDKAQLPAFCLARVTGTKAPHSNTQLPRGPWILHYKTQLPEQDQDSYCD